MRKKDLKFVNLKMLYNLFGFYFFKIKDDSLGLGKQFSQWLGDC